jgi:hypothetical protein
MRFNLLPLTDAVPCALLIPNSESCIWMRIEYGSRRRARTHRHVAGAAWEARMAWDALAYGRGLSASPAGYCLSLIATLEG